MTSFHVKKFKNVYLIFCFLSRFFFNRSRNVSSLQHFCLDIVSCDIIVRQLVIFCDIPTFIFKTWNLNFIFFCVQILCEGIFQSGNFSGYFSKLQLPKSVVATALGTLTCSSRSIRSPSPSYPQSSPPIEACTWCLRRPNPT